MTAQADADSTQKVRFYLNGELHQLDNPPATTTVLQYLREQAGLTGTKEGCAEGDCGACTCVVIEPHAERYRLRSINSCIQFLPTLDGKELLTVEGLRGSDDTLHPAQRALIEQHGSQCGFCTPGFVMSLFALFQTNAAPDRAEIEQALSGNLCRCTGYRPIVDAAHTMYGLAADRADWKQCAHNSERDLLAGEQVLIERLDQIQRPQTLALSGPSRYFAPTSVAQLADLIERHPQATVLAGGTDVGLWVTKQYRDLPTVIYLGDVADLDVINVESDVIEIGAAVKLTSAFGVLNQHYPGLAELWRRFASPPICNAGTLVGNVANASPIGDSMPALLCLDTELVLQRGEQLRTLPLTEFYLDYQKTALSRGEFVRALRLPRLSQGSQLQSYKLSKRYDQDISAVCAAFLLRLDDAGRVAQLAIGYGGLAATPSRAEQTEQALQGQPWNEATVREALATLAQDFTPIDDMRASAAYRRQGAANLLLRFYYATQGQHSDVFALRSGAA